MKIRFLIGIPFGLLAIFATACASTPTPAPPIAPTIIAPTAAAPPTVGPTATKAPLQGTLNLLCTTQEEWCAGMKKEFESKNPGVIVNYTRLSATEALTRLRNEKTSPTFDSWGGSGDSLSAAKKDGLLEPYKTSAQANIIDPKLMIDQDAHPQWVGIYIGPLGFASNSKQSAIKPPTSFDDLTKPELKGQIAIAHPASSNASYIFLCTVLQAKGEKDGWEYIKKFAQNVAIWTKSDAAPVQNVGKGDAAVGLALSQDIIAGMQDQGLPLLLSFPSEGTGYDIGGMAIVKGAKNPDLAKAWYDWLLVPSTQELGQQYHMYLGLTIKGATPPKPELSQVKLINYNFDYCASNKAGFTDKFSSEVSAASLAK